MLQQPMMKKLHALKLQGFDEGSREMEELSEIGAPEWTVRNECLLSASVSRY